MNEENQVIEKLKEMEEKIDSLYRSAERIRKILIWTLIFALATVVLPMIGLFFALPNYLATFKELGLQSFCRDQVLGNKSPDLATLQCRV